MKTIQKINSIKRFISVSKKIKDIHMTKENGVIMIYKNNRNVARFNLKGFSKFLKSWTFWISVGTLTPILVVAGGTYHHPTHPPVTPPVASTTPPVASSTPPTTSSSTPPSTTSVVAPSGGSNSFSSSGGGCIPGGLCQTENKALVDLLNGRPTSTPVSTGGMPIEEVRKLNKNLKD